MNAAPLHCRFFVLLSLTLALGNVVPQTALAREMTAACPAPTAVSRAPVRPLMANFLSNYIMNDRGRMVQIATLALIVGLLILMKR